MTSVAGSVPALRVSTPHIDWWHEYRDQLPTGYLELIAAEANARRIIHSHPIVVPGLLQTRDYATAVTSVTVLNPVSPDQAALLVDVRLRRQHEILTRSASVTATFFLDQTALRRRVGSPSTMRAQLTHLLAMLDHPAVTVLVVPFATDPHPGLLGPFMLMRAVDGTGDVLCFEGQTGNILVRDRPDLMAGYVRLVERLAAISYTGDAVAELIRTARDDVT
jgi:hypothetical protein